MRLKTALTLKPGDTVTWTTPPRGPVHEVEFITQAVVRFVTKRGGIKVWKMKNLAAPASTDTRVKDTYEEWVPYHHITSYRRANKQRRDYTSVVKQKE